VTPPASSLAPVRPEVVIDGFEQRRPRWIEIATSPDHKDIGRFLITAALGFLFVALVELLLIRLQLAIPENTLLSPETFNRLLSVYGATTVFLFGIPLALGLFYYVVPLQIGARSTALPRVGQTGLWLYAAGGTTLYASFLFTPPEAGVNPLPPLSDVAHLPNNGVDVWLAGTGLATLGFVLLALDLIATLRHLRAPGMAWRRVPVFSWAAAISSWLLMVIGPVMLAAIAMLMIDRNFDGVFFDAGEGGAPLLWQHLSWIFYTGTYVLLVVFALGAIAEIVPSLSGKPLFNRGAVIGSLGMLAALGTLAWMQNMYAAPVSIGFLYFAMAMAMLAALPVGLVIFNLVATMAGGALRLRAPLLFALGAISTLSIGLAGELTHSAVAIGRELGGTTDSTANTHYALAGAAVFGGFAALYYWFPKICGRTMGEALGRLSFWAMLVGVNLGFLPLALAGLQGEPIDTYKFFAGTGVSADNLIATIGIFILAFGIVLTLANAAISLRKGHRAGHDPWRGSTLEWFTESPPPMHNFDVIPDVRSAEPLRDIRDAIRRREQAAAAATAEPAQPVA
jgi:heme/copper-type cytochrome/quinol oxidase subunit 1